MEEYISKEQKIERIHQLSTSHAPDNIAELIRYLFDEDHEVRRLVITSLARMNREAVLDSFPCIDNKLKPYVAKLLNRIDSGIADRLSRDLSNLDSARRVRAIDMMVRLGKKEGVREALRRVVRDEDSKVRASAIKAIGLLGTDQDLAILIELVEDDDPRVRANVIEGLENLGDESTIRLLLRFTNDENNRIRANSIKALWNLGYKEVEPFLKTMLENPDEWMRASACWVIGELKDSKLASLLDTMREDNSVAVRINVIRALEKIGMPEAISKIREFEDDPSVEVRAAVISILSKSG